MTYISHICVIANMGIDPIDATYHYETVGHSSTLGLLDCHMVHQPFLTAALFSFIYCLQGYRSMETAFDTEECCYRGWLMH